MLTNYDIPKIFKFYNTPLTFIGMKNQLSKKVVDGNYIINLESAPMNGSHWLALTIRGNHAFYVDSFAGPPPLEVIAFVKRRRGCHLFYNNVIIQDLKSENCGYYASACLIYLHRHQNNTLIGTARQYLKLYHDDSRENDDILRSVFHKFAPVSPPLIARLNNEHIKY